MNSSSGVFSTSKNVLWLPGGNFSDVGNGGLLEKFEEVNFVIGLPGSEQRSNYKWPFNVIKVFWFDDLKKPIEESVHEVALIQKIIEEILNDSKSFYLMERVFKYSKENSVFNLSIYIINFVINSLKLLQKYRIERIILPTTPHSLTWYLCRVANFMNIPVILTSISPIPWKRILVEWKNTPILIPNESQDSDSEKVLKWLLKFNLGYESFMPSYEKVRLDAFSRFGDGIMGQVYAVLTSKSFYDLKGRLYDFRHKIIALKLYNGLAKAFTVPNKYICFLLHFQPERTSLPEGGSYAQQYRLIVELSSALPEGMVLVVKEHPSMFRNKFSSRVRSKSFYYSVSRLPNVEVAPLNIDMKEFIVKSKGVVTLTGTVGIEAVANGIPALVYGMPLYYSMPGIVLARDFQFDPSKCIEELINTKVHYDDIVNYFLMIDRLSYTIDKSDYRHTQDSKCLKAAITYKF